MSQNNQNQWPKAFVAIFGTAIISAASYLLNVPQMMWYMVLLCWVISYFD